MRWRPSLEAPRETPPPGGWLHFDVSVGCAGDMLGAALLDLTGAEDALRAALEEAGLNGIGPRAVAERQAGVAGLHLDYVDQSGRPVDAPSRPRGPAPARRPHAGARTDPRAPHVDVRRATRKEEQQLVDPEDVGGRVTAHPGADDAGAGPLFAAPVGAGGGLAVGRERTGR